MSKEISEEQFNHDIPPSRLEKSFRELVNEEFVKDIRKYLIHEVRNLSYHFGYSSIFDLEHIDHYERVKIEPNGMLNQFFQHSDDDPTMVDALVIPFMDGYGSACHIKLCISIDDVMYPTYEVKFQIRGARAWSRVRVRPHTALKIIKTLQYPNKVF